MRSSQYSVQSSRSLLAALAVMGLALIPSAVLAESADLEELAANPHDYLEQQVEVSGYCKEGGLNGDVLGYECTTDGTIYVDARKIEPETAKQTISEKCDEKSLLARSASCRATVRFVPHSFTTSTKIEPGKNITIFNAEKAEVSF